MYHLGLDPERYPRHHHNQTGWDVGVEHKVSKQIDIKLHFTFLFKIKKTILQARQMEHEISEEIVLHLRNLALFHLELKEKTIFQQLFPFLFNLTKFVSKNFRTGFIWKNHNHAILPTWSTSNQFDVEETHPSLFNKMVNLDL